MAQEKDLTQGRRRISISLFSALIAEGIGRIFPIFVVFFVARKLGSEVYGAGQFAVQLVEGSVLLSTLGFRLSALYGFRDVKNKDALVSEVIVLRLVFSLLFTGILLFLTYFYYREYFYLVSCLSFIPVFSALELSFVLMAEQKIHLINIFSASIKLFALIGIIVLVQSPDDILTFLLLSYGINGLVGVWTFWMGRKYIVGVSMTSLKERFQKNIPFLVALFAVIIFDKAEFLLIEHYGSAKELGLFSASYRIYMSIFTFSLSLSFVFLSEAARGGVNFALNFQRVLRTLMVVLFPVIVGSYFVDQRLMVLIFGEGFLGSPLFYLLLSLFPHCMMVVLGEQILAANHKIYKYAAGIAVGALVLLFSFHYFYESYGLLGACLSFLFSKCIATGILFYWSHDYCESPFAFFSFKTDVLPLLLMIVALILNPFLSLMWTLLMAVFVYVAAVLIFNKTTFLELKNSIRK